MQQANLNDVLEEYNRNKARGLEPYWGRPGSKLVSPEQQANGKRWWKEQQERALEELEKREEEKDKAKRRKDVPHYFFIFSESDYSDLKPATMVRLIYLATYLGYDGKLYLPHNKPIKRQDLPGVMGLSVAAVSDFLNEAMGRYLFMDKEKRLYMPGEFFHKGKFKTNRIYQQIFTDSIRRLYRMTPTVKHRHLGYMFQMVPFINVEYNVLCTDVFETDLEKICPLSLNEFCKAIGYDPKNRYRLVREYSQILFPVKGRPQRFSSFVTNGLSLDTAWIYVNPNILYHGNNPGKVEVLGKFSEIVSPKQESLQ